MKEDDEKIVINSFPGNRKLKSKHAKDIFPGGFRSRQLHEVDHPLTHMTKIVPIRSFQQFPALSSYMRWAQGGDEPISRSNTSLPLKTSVLKSSNDSVASRASSSPNTRCNNFDVHDTSKQPSFMNWTRGQQFENADVIDDAGDPFADVAGPYYRKKQKDDSDMIPSLKFDSNIGVVSKAAPFSSRKRMSPNSKAKRERIYTAPAVLPHLPRTVSPPMGILGISGGLGTMTFDDWLQNIDNMDNTVDSLAPSVGSLPAKAKIKVHKEFQLHKHLAQECIVELFKASQLISSTQPTAPIQTFVVGSKTPMSMVYRIIFEQEAPGDVFNSRGEKMIPEVYFFHTFLQCWRVLRKRGDWAAAVVAALERQESLKLMYTFKRFSIHEAQKMEKLHNVAVRSPNGQNVSYGLFDSFSQSNCKSSQQLHQNHHTASMSSNSSSYSPRMLSPVGLGLKMQLMPSRPGSPADRAHPARKESSLQTLTDTTAVTDHSIDLSNSSPNSTSSPKSLNANFNVQVLLHDSHSALILPTVDVPELGAPPPQLGRSSRSSTANHGLYSPPGTAHRSVSPPRVRTTSPQKHRRVELDTPGVLYTQLPTAPAVVSTSKPIKEQQEKLAEILEKRILKTRW